MQRLRIRFGRDADVKYASHLDIGRCWERAFRRAEVRLAYTQGYTPRPRMAFAVPLQVGITSQAELVDAWLRVWMPPESLVMSLRYQLPAGLPVYDAWEVLLGMPSLQSSVAMAEYRVRACRQLDEPEVRRRLQELLEAAELPWHQQRGQEMRSYDLRALIRHVWLESTEDSAYTLGMRLQCDQSGTGRPEQVAAALGLAERPLCIHRTRLLLRPELE